MRGLVPPRNRCYEMPIVAGSFRVRTADASGRRHRWPRAYLPTRVFSLSLFRLCFPLTLLFPGAHAIADQVQISRLPTSTTIALFKYVFHDQADCPLPHTRAHARTRTVALYRPLTCPCVCRVSRSYRTNKVGLSSPVKLDLDGSRKLHGD